MSSDQANDILFGSAVPAAKFANTGDSVTGAIVKLDSSQQTKYRKDKTKAPEPLTWPDGKPKMQVIVTLQTTLRDPSIADDDGKRRVFIKGKNFTNAVRAAVRGAGANRLDEGGTLTVTFTGEEESDWDGNPAKVYAVSYTKPSGAAAAAAVLGTVATPAPAAAVQQTVDTSGMSSEAQAMLAKLLAQQAAGAQS